MAPGSAVRGQFKTDGPRDRTDTRNAPSSILAVTLYRAAPATTCHSRSDSRSTVPPLNAGDASARRLPCEVVSEMANVAGSIANCPTELSSSTGALAKAYVEPGIMQANTMAHTRAIQRHGQACAETGVVGI
ncbi:hypothetical protein D3C71_1444430 [compost metagenome]